MFYRTIDKLYTAQKCFFKGFKCRVRIDIEHKLKHSSHKETKLIFEINIFERKNIVEKYLK